MPKFEADPDSGAMRRAREYVDPDTHERAPLIATAESETEGKVRWQCKICQNGARVRECKKDKLYDAYKSHVLHCHDPKDHWDRDGTEESTWANYLWPVSSVTERAKKAEKVVKTAEKKAAELAAAPASGEIDGGLDSCDALGAAVDALVAAGFKASGDELAWLATEVKQRLGGAEPPPKKPRGLARELALLNAAKEQLELPEARGDAARVHARRRR